MKKITLVFATIVGMLTVLNGQATTDPELSRQEKGTRIWQESISFPTYLVDDPDPNPRFYDGRAYQLAAGCSGHWTRRTGMILYTDSM